MKEIEDILKLEKTVYLTVNHCLKISLIGNFFERCDNSLRSLTSAFKLHKQLRKFLDNLTSVTRVLITIFIVLVVA